MKQSVLALALAVLPVAHAASADQANHCFVKYTCLRQNSEISAGIKAEATGTVALNGGSTSASSFANCLGGAANAGSGHDHVKGAAVVTAYYPATAGFGGTAAELSYVADTGIFDPKGRAPTATKDCLVALTGADAKKAAAGTEGPKVKPIAILRQVYTDNTCATRVGGADVGTYAKFVSGRDAVADSGKVDDSTNSYGAEATRLLLADAVFQSGPTGLLKGLPGMHDIGMGVDTDGFAKVPAKFLPEGHAGKDNVAEPVNLTADATGATGCATFGAALAGKINAKNAIADATAAASTARFAPYLAGNAAIITKAGGKTVLAYAGAAGTEALKIAPAAITMHCSSTDGALTIQYHKEQATPAALGACTTGKSDWSAPNMTDGKLSCFASPIRNADCKGTDTCTAGAIGVLQHIVTETGADKKCGTATVNLGTADKPNKLCSKDCLCPATHGKVLNAAVGGACFESATTQLGQFKVELVQGMPTAVDALLQKPVPATGLAGPNRSLVESVFTQAETLLGMTKTGLTAHNMCGQLVVGAQATDATAAAKALVDVAYDDLWTATKGKGCGVAAADTNTGGAAAQFATTFATGAFALLVAGLF